MAPGEKSPDTTVQERLPILRLVVIAAAVAGIGFLAWTVSRYLSAEVIFAHYDNMRAAVAARPLHSLVTFIGIYGLFVAFSVPGAAVLTLVGGLLFGGLLGGIGASISATLGAIVAFVVARTALGPLLAERGGPRLRAIMAGIRADAANYLLFMRLAPVFPFWMVNMAAAIVRVPLRVFVWTTAIGILPAAFAVAFAGSALDGVVRQQKTAFDACMAARQPDCGFDIRVQHVLTPGILASLLALAVLALLPVLLRRAGIMPQSRGKSPG